MSSFKPKQNNPSNYRNKNKKHMTDIYPTFLNKVNEYFKKKPKSTFQDYVDGDLTNLYLEAINNVQKEQNPNHTPNKPRPPKNLDQTLKQFDNPQLQQLIILNYYFDHTYLLNMDKRTDRLEAMKKDFKKYNIFNWTRWTGLDGKEPPHCDEYTAYKRSRMSAHERQRFHRKAIGSAGSWAILKSMYTMLDDALKKGYKSILVYQDDLLFHKDFENLFTKIPEQVPNNWKLLYLGGTQHNWIHTEFRPNYYFPMGTADGAFAVGIDRSIFKELMTEIVKFDMPFDSGALKTVQKRYGRQAIIMYPNLTIADIRDSDLRGSRDLGAHGKKFRWNTSLYNIPFANDMRVSPHDRVKTNK